MCVVRALDGPLSRDDPSAMADTFYDKVLPVLTGVGVAASVAMSGVALPIVIGQGRDIQKLQDQIEVVHSDVSTLKTSVEAIDKRERQAETDPDKIISKVLGVPAEFVSIGTVSFIDDKVVVFPKNVADSKKLVDAGYALMSVTPTISGYAAPMSVSYPKR